MADEELGLESTVDGSDETAQSAPSSPGRLSVGAKLGRYEIASFLGEGAMGAVYRARDPELARDVAVKRIAHAAGSIDEARTRLRREAQAMARVDHAAVVKIYDVGVDDNQLFVAMELVDGGTLAQWLAARPRPWREIVALLVTVGRGLAAAHAAGLVHRDIKPANILVDSAGRARISDFGLARAVAGDPGQDSERSLREVLDVDLTITGSLVGTPAYMAPEQLDAGVVTAAADQFSFAVALWEALYGERPFQHRGTGAAALASLRAAIAEGRIEPPAKSPVPRRLESILRRALAAHPAKRWPSLTALVDALAALARPRRTAGLVAGGLVIGCLAVLAILRPWASKPATATLRLGVERTIEQADDPTPLTTLLRDGSVARVIGNYVAITGLTGASRALVPLPEARGNVLVAASRVEGGFVAGDFGKDRCAFWLLSTRGAAPQRFWEDGCQASWADLSPDRETVAFTDADRIAARAVGASLDRWSRTEPNVHDAQWSPGGTSVAAVGSETVILAAATGAELARIQHQVANLAWLDDDRLLYALDLGEGRGEVRLLELASRADESILAVDGRVARLDAATSGFLVTLWKREIQIYVVPRDPPAATDLDDAKPIDTGAEADHDVLGWTADGQVLSRSSHADLTDLIRTRPGEHGAIVRSTKDPVWLHGAAGRVLWVEAPSSDHCVASGIEVATNTKHALAGFACKSENGACGVLPPRCVFASPEGELYWLDVDTGIRSAAPPMRLTPASSLSPDGTELVHVAEQITIGKLDGVETALVLDPALPEGERILGAAFGGPGELLVVTVRGKGTDSVYSLLVATRDGHWKRIVHATRSIESPIASPDGRSIVFVATTASLTAGYLPDPRALTLMPLR